MKTKQTNYIHTKTINGHTAYAANLPGNNLSISIIKPKLFPRIKDPGSAITHFIAMIFAIVATPALLVRAGSTHDFVHIFSLSIFILTMIALYAASTNYHTFDLSKKKNELLKKADHMMISVMIASSYTPVCLLVVNGHKGIILCTSVWIFAIAGILIKAFWIYCPKWFSSILYIAMGWMCVFAFSDIYATLSKEAFAWLLGGGIFYTVGGIIYSLKMPGFNKRHPYFGTHEIFHLFVMAGSFCHYILMYQYLAVIPN